MALTGQQARETAVQMVREDPGQTLGRTALTKADLVAALNAVDSWCTTNQASYLAALPEPFKSNSTAAQKAAALSYVALRRWAG